MEQDQIRNVYDLIQKGQYLLAIRQTTNYLDRIRSKFKQNNLNDQTENILLLIALRGLSHLRLGNLIQAKDDINKVIEIKPLNEEIIIILWHYYIIHGTFLDNNDSLKELANYFQDACNLDILSEQFEIDILSLYYYLKDFHSMKSLCNKYYKKCKKSYFLALNIFISFLIFQNQIINNVNNDKNGEDVLLLLLINKYLKENASNLESMNDLKLIDRRIITTINFIKLFVFRKKRNLNVYKDILKGLNESKHILYPCINNENIFLLNNYFILDEAEFNLKNNCINNNKNNNKIIIYKDTLIELIKSFDANIEIDWDNLRVIKLYIVRLFNEALELNKNSFQRDEMDNNTLNNTLLKQSSQSSQVTNCSSFQTQSTISSFSSNYFNSFNDGNLTLLDKIFNIISINDDDEDFYEGKNRLSLFLLSDAKGRILFIELLIEILINIENNNYMCYFEFLNENLLNIINNEILNLINSNDTNIIIDLKVSLSNYFKNKNRNINDHLICIIFNDLKYLLNIDILENLTNWNYYSSRLFVLTMFNQYKFVLENANISFFDQFNFNSIEIIQILNNVFNKKIINNIINEKELKSSYIWFLTSLSLYCMSLKNKDDDYLKNEFNYISISLFILIFMNNHLIDHNVDYLVNHLISEFLPIIGSFSISHNISYNILKVKRSQIVTLNLYGNFLEISSCPYFNIIHKKIKNDNISQLQIDQLYTFKSRSIEDSYKFNFDNVKTILNSCFDVYNELKETCIESLRENSYSIQNALNSSKLIDNISKDNIIELLFGIDFLNSIFSLLLLSLSKKNNNIYDIFSLFNNYKTIIKNFIDKNINIEYDDKLIKQDLSPIINYITPIYNIEYQFKDMSNDLIPINYFKYKNCIDIFDKEFIGIKEEFFTEILKYVNGLPKIKYVITQKLKIWLNILLIFNDLIIENDLDLNRFNEKVLNLKNKILLDKYYYLIPNFDLELFEKVIIPLIQHFFEIILTGTKNKSDSNIIKNEIEFIVEIINSELNYLINNNIIQLINNSKMNYFQIQIILENITSILFGPSLFLTFIQIWIYHNFSKKLLSSFFKTLTNSHLNFLQNIYTYIKNILNDFNGTIEIDHCQKLSALFNRIPDLSLNKNEFNIEIQELKDSQYITIDNICNLLLYIINCIKYSNK